MERKLLLYKRPVTGGLQKRPVTSGGLQKRPITAKPAIERKPLKVNIPRKRLPAPFIPTYEGPIEGFSVNFLRKNLWKVQGFLEFADLKQESYEVFLRCKKQYTGPVQQPVTNPKHFMALFKTALRNQLYTLSLKIWNDRHHLVADEYDNEEALSVIKNLIGELDGDGPLQLMVNEAPPQVKAVLELMTTKSNQLETAWQEHKAAGGKVDISNALLCKILGYDPTIVNLLTLVKDYFTV